MSTEIVVAYEAASSEFAVRIRTGERTEPFLHFAAGASSKLSQDDIAWALGRIVLNAARVAYGGTVIGTWAASSPEDAAERQEREDLLRSRAALGNSDGMFMLSRHLSDKAVFLREASLLAEAWAWLSRASAAGHADAQRDLAQWEGFRRACMATIEKDRSGG